MWRVAHSCMYLLKKTHCCTELSPVKFGTPIVSSLRMKNFWEQRSNQSGRFQFFFADFDRVRTVHYKIGQLTGNGDLGARPPRF